MSPAPASPRCGSIPPSLDLGPASLKHSTKTAFGTSDVEQELGLTFRGQNEHHFLTVESGVCSGRDDHPAASMTWGTNDVRGRGVPECLPAFESSRGISIVTARTPVPPADLRRYGPKSSMYCSMVSDQFCCEWHGDCVLTGPRRVRTGPMRVVVIQRAQAVPVDQLRWRG